MARYVVNGCQASLSLIGENIDLKLKDASNKNQEIFVLGYKLSVSRLLFLVSKLSHENEVS